MTKEKSKEKKQTVESERKAQPNIAGAVSMRGRVFQGTVVRKFPKRVAIEFGRTVKIPKFERFTKKKTRIHARLPDQMSHDIHLGDLIKVQECRPLSKIINFLVIEKVKSSQDDGGRK